MSNSAKGSKKTKDAPEPTPYSPGLSISDFQKMSEIFKAWADGSNLKWWVIAAGIGAILEGLHILWLAVRYVFRF